MDPRPSITLAHEAVLHLTAGRIDINESTPTLRMHKHGLELEYTGED
ncbi:hypothetical protein RSAG8_11935, partial [Rhizoctonia solani AG-8 WAC10335]